MKNFNKDKLADFGRKFLRALPTMAILVTILVFAVLTYLAVVPRVDDDARAAGSAEMQSLDIHFNTKLLTDLANTSKPSTVSETGGRDPFSPF